MTSQDIPPINKTPSDPRTKVMALLIIGLLTFLICFGFWIWRLIDLSQKEKNKTFKNSLWLTFLLPWGIAIPIIYLAGLSFFASFISSASWWVYPTILFTAMDSAFLIASLVGKYLPSSEEELKTTLVTTAKEEVTFQCGICYTKYKEHLLGAETVREGKICRFCLEKKQQK